MADGKGGSPTPPTMIIREPLSISYVSNVAFIAVVGYGFISLEE
jgi:hypothetical protein